MSERVPNVLLDFGTAVWSLPLIAMGHGQTGS
jgi:hypothetical protein